MTSDSLVKALPIPERIIFCIDVDAETGNTDYTKPKKGENRLTLIRNAIKMFMEMKMSMNPNNEFAVATLTKKAEWILGFTSNLETILEVVNSLKPQKSFGEFSMDSFFEIMKKNIPGEDLKSKKPKFVYRSIFIYSRTSIKPTISEETDTKRLLNSPHFYFDVLYFYNSKSKNEPQQVFDELIQYDSDTKYMMFLCNPTSDKRIIFSNIAKLLAHPLQRTSQDLQVPQLGKDDGKFKSLHR